MFLLALASCALLSPTDPDLVYVVQRGDTLGEIAGTHGVTVAQLKDWNGLDSDLIEIGQQLVIKRQPAPVVSNMQRPRIPGGASAPQPSPPARPSLSMPAAKKCLGGPDPTALDDRDMAASTGLDAAGVRNAMNAFLPNVQPCLADLSTPPSGTLLLSIRVGCDGRVMHVGIDGRDDWPESAATCITDTLRYAPFPAHALPDGDTFQYPMRMLVD